MTVQLAHLHAGQHELRALVPVECEWPFCHEPASPSGRGYCGAHAQLREDIADDARREAEDER